MSSIMGAGRPHTPNLSSINLARTATVGLVHGNGGIATQLSRVASKAQLVTAAGAGEHEQVAGQWHCWVAA